MKNKIMAMLVAFGMVGSVSAVEINENLSINGFIDGSITKTDNGAGVDLNGDSVADGDDANWGLDEIEVNFLFNVGSVSGTVALDSQDIGNGSEDDLEIEQAHFTYTLENGVSLTFGRYGSALGLEREDPAGLYTFSRAYGGSPFDIGNIDQDGNAREGLNISYAADAWTLGVSIDNKRGSVRSNNTKDDLDFEVSLSYTGIENLTLNIGHRADNEPTATPSNDADFTNINATYQVGKALLGAEWSQIDTASADLDAHMFLVDYDVSDKLGVAVRYSSYEASVGEDVDQITIAPNYAITDSLGAILEYSDVSREAAGLAGNSNYSDTIALELTYTF
jgi:hypothetical protein